MYRVNVYYLCEIKNLTLHKPPPSTTFLYKQINNLFILITVICQNKSKVCYILH